MKKIAITILLSAMPLCASGQHVYAQDFASNQKAAAYDCIRSQSEGYGLASCERAADLVRVVESTCKRAMHEYTDALFRDKRMSSLSLDKRLELTEQIHNALISHVPKLVLDARIRDQKKCN